MKFIQTDIEWQLPGAEGRGELGCYCLMDAEFQLCKMKRVLEMGAGDACTTM